MDLELDGKTAILTGGSKGIGKATAMELAREGVDLAICSRGSDALENAAAEVGQATGRRVVPIAADVTDRASVETMVERAASDLGRIDILVNNAAMPGGLVMGPLAEAQDEDLMADLNTKVLGYLRCARAAAPHMQLNGWGRIVNIAGLAARSGGSISGMRNAAVVHLTKTLSAELGPHGITVNTIHPGTTRTERSGPAYEEERAARQGVSVEEVERGVAEGIAIRRIVDAREIAYLVAFLVSPKAEAITGEAIAAGGGAGLSVFCKSGRPGRGLRYVRLVKVVARLGEVLMNVIVIVNDSFRRDRL